jgi:hypothetical protein
VSKGAAKGYFTRLSLAQGCRQPAAHLVVTKRNRWARQRP